MPPARKICRFIRKVIIFACLQGTDCASDRNDRRPSTLGSGIFIVHSLYTIVVSQSVSQSVDPHEGEKDRPVREGGEPGWENDRPTAIHGLPGRRSEEGRKERKERPTQVACIEGEKPKWDVSRGPHRYTLI